ncbi:hypothetical protein GPECTOR_81g207 [Gonium pectorale]|uniref:Ankyrin repeat domain-containing protein n=1 Tax=Gonium pectorale TaxID=33097 RepID=A0A150G1N2_GONPE|nr:hypothetical protein GPECTOR_81g207 [Gonium pectorale]|eukprot:KXZ43757.1 hypothetical protein GPECTOR_81g207 [Gonium pectorale]
MATQETEVGTAPCDAALPLPNVWIPGLVERFASFLHPNEVICTLRCVDKATAAQFRGRPEFATVRLSQPTPPHAFAARWAAPGAMRDLTLAQRKQLLHLAAASGVMANLEVVLEAVGWVLDLKELTPPLNAAASGGHVDVVRCLMGLARHLGPWPPPEITSSLGAAVEAGHTAVCEALFQSIGAQDLWSVMQVCAALRAGRPGMADWLLQQRPERPIGSGCSLAPLGEEACAALLHAAAEGCDLPTLSSLHQRCCGVGMTDSEEASELLTAAASCTADWQAKDDGGPYTSAASNGDLAMLRCLARLGCPWGPASGAAAVFEYGAQHSWPLPVMRLLVELGCPVDWEASLAASRRSFLGVPKEMRYWLAAEAARWRRQKQQQGAEEARKRQQQERIERAVRRQKRDGAQQ